MGKAITKENLDFGGGCPQKFKKVQLDHGLSFLKSKDYVFLCGDDFLQGRFLVFITEWCSIKYKNMIK